MATTRQSGRSLSDRFDPSCASERVVRLLVDAQLPPALARWLAAQGHEGQHVFDMEMAQASDAAIWQRAVDSAAVVVTKDEDFALRAQMRDDGLPLSGFGMGTFGGPSCSAGSPRFGRASWRP